MATLLDTAGTAHREAAQAGDAGGDGDGQLEGQEGFAALGLAADDADGFFRPQPIDEPARLSPDLMRNLRRKGRVGAERCLSRVLATMRLAPLYMEGRAMGFIRWLPLSVDQSFKGVQHNF